MVIAGTWDYQEGRTHGTPLAGTPELASNRDRRDAPPWCVLPLVVVVVDAYTLIQIFLNHSCFIYFMNTDNKLLKMLFVIYFWVLKNTSRYLRQLVIPFRFAVIEQKWPKIVFMSEISFELQIIFKINIHILAQFLHVERAYELQVFLSDSEARKHVIWTPLAWMSLASPVCCVFLRECCSLVRVRRLGLMAVTLSF